MKLPEALMQDEPLFWSAGRGSDVGALFEACVAGDLASVRALLDRDPSLVRCHFAYRTPLYFAVRENRLEVVALLLERGADPISLAVGDSLVEISRDRGYGEMEDLLTRAMERRFGASVQGEPIAEAVRARDPAKVRELLDRRPELLHAGDLRSNRPLHWAVMTRQLDLIDELLDRGADVDARRFDGARPIHLTNGDYHYRGWRDVPKEITTTPEAVYRHLVKRGARVDLGMAAATGDAARVRDLLDEDPGLANRVSEYQSYYLGCGAPLKNAAAAGHLEIVRLLLDRGADPNLPEEGIAPRGHALYAAVANGHYEIARVLLEHGASPNVEVESSADALSRALARGDRRLVDLLCSYGAARPVHLLAYDDDLETAAAVFAANPALADDPEALTNAGSIGFVRLLLRYRPELVRRLTVSKSRTVTEFLFERGMDPDRPDWLGVTALHHLARRGDLEGAALFLDHGANPDVRDDDLGSTPLGWAAKYGQVGMVELLLRRGARSRLPDDPPWASPVAWAERRGHPEVVELLRDHDQWGVVTPRMAVRDCEDLADLVAAACDQGATSDALAEVGRRLRLNRPPGQEEWRRRVHECLGRDPTDAWPTGLAPEESRRVVARLQGFRDWADLVADLGERAREAGRVAAWKEADGLLLAGDDRRLQDWLIRSEDLVARHRPPPYWPCGVERDFSGGDAREVIRRAHDFETWKGFEDFRAAVARPASEAARFEAAVDMVVGGKPEGLRQLLGSHPGLVRSRSSRRHGATLLHYVGANGVEGFRQRTPRATVEVARVLLDAGAEVDAVAPMYGGSTPLGLVATSVHPESAGLQLDLLRLLLDRGASPASIGAAAGSRALVNACLANGRRAAAEFLASRGAPLDLEAAAGVGRLDRVRSMLDAGVGASEPGEESRRTAFQWACEFGRTEVVIELLGRGMEASEVYRGSTGLHWAAYGGHGGIVRILLEHGASIDVEDGAWGRTPLGWAVYGWRRPPPWGPLDRYHEVAACLVAAGSKVEPRWLDDRQVRLDGRLHAILRNGSREAG